MVSAQQHLETFADLRQVDDPLVAGQLEKGLERLAGAIVAARRFVTYLGQGEGHEHA